MAKRKRYTNAQRKAYYSGMGYRTAYEGKGIDFQNNGCRDSFKAGFNQGGRVISKNYKKYPTANKFKVVNK